MSETLTASLEDYIEAIFHIVARKRAARAKDIARRMHVNNSSVTGALHALSERGLVNYAPYDVITLTDEGTEIAKDVVRRHEVLRDFFVRVLSLDDEEADDRESGSDEDCERCIVSCLDRVRGSHAQGEED